MSNNVIYEQEEWRWIKGFEGCYKVSNMGRLMSFVGDKSGRVLSIKNKNGDYYRIVLRNGNARRSVSIHVLVAETFIGDIQKGFHVHHKDGNKQNNCVSNLEIISTKEHHIKSLAINPSICDGMHNYNKYVRTRRIRQYTLDGQFIAEYVNGAVASHYTGICQRNILQVANKTEYKPGTHRKQAGGFVWVFADEDNET